MPNNYVKCVVVLKNNKFDEATQELNSLGLEIATSSKARFTVGGSKNLLERIFNTTLVKDIKSNNYLPQREVSIPKSLQDYVSAVYFPTSPTHF